jgi:hypothetical protein
MTAFWHTETLEFQLALSPLTEVLEVRDWNLRCLVAVHTETDIGPHAMAGIEVLDNRPRTTTTRPPRSANMFVRVTPGSGGARP